MRSRLVKPLYLLSENSAVQQCLTSSDEKVSGQAEAGEPQAEAHCSCKNKGRNSRRNEKRKADPHQAKKASLQVQVSRAKKKLDKVRLDGSSPEAVHKATVDLAVAHVERYKFTTSIGIERSIQPSAEDWELAASHP